ncbi:MAG: TIGR03545 family protein, partial [Proteobacteria bacterium]|nr:TIGR03545 family protein [Pseudomonadota bacterium]
FAVIVGSLCALFILFIDTLIENGIEAAGSDIIGAKVELGNVDFSFSPLGVSLNHLQVTNPDAPMSNIVEIDNIAFAMDGSYLIRRKLLINEMNIDGLHLNTPRKYSGAIAKTKKATLVTESKKTDKKSVTNLPSFEMPDVDDILKKEPLKVDKAANILKTDISETKQSWENLKTALPGQKRLDSHKARFNELRNVNDKDIKKLKAAINEYKALKADIAKDSALIKQTQNKIKNDTGRLNNELKVLISSPKEDYKHLLSKYSLSTEGATNIGVMFFGDKVKTWSDTAIYWYNKLQPFISKIELSGGEDKPEPKRGAGKNIHFTEYHPRPDFLIKKVHIGVELEAGKFNGEVLNITSQQPLVGKPITFSFNANKMQRIKSLKLNGEFNRLKATPEDHVQLSIRNYDMDNFSLLKEDKLTISIADAKSDLTIKATRIANKINANVNNRIHSIKFSNSSTGGGEIIRMLVAALDDINSFKIDGRLYGTLDNYHTRISSDLDKKLGTNLKAQTRKLKQDFQGKLKSKLDKTSKRHTNEAKQELDALHKYEKEIQKRKQQFDKQLSSVQKQIDTYKSDINAKAKNKVNDKLKGLFK